MAAESQFVIDLAIVVAGGFLGAVAARALRLPTVAGYLAVGVLLGPAGTGLVGDSEIISSLAELGVGLLLFAIGVEVSLNSLVRMKPAALVAAPAQIVLTAGLGYGIGQLIGWGEAASVVLGFSLALSSTMVVVKLLSERGELHTRHGQAMLAMLLVQDLAAVFMVAALPLLSGAGGGLHLVMGRAALFVIGVYVLARYVAPVLMRAVARHYSREVFAVMSGTLCFGGAAVAHVLGFSLAMGAFAAGLMISHSHYRHQVLSDVTPLRDLLATVFFVSLGLLWEPQAIWGQWAWAALLLAAVLVGKPIIATASLLLARYHPRNAVAAGLGLGQIGEFSFLVMTLAWRAGVLGDAAHALLIPIAGVTLLLSPALMRLGEIGYGRLSRSGLGEKLIACQEERPGSPAPEMEGHVVLCGYGRVGGLVGEVLRGQRQPLVVIDYDHEAVVALRGSGTPAVYGDASRRAVLEAAGASRARLAIIALPDGASSAAAISELQTINPSLLVIARAHGVPELEALCQTGADEVVYPEYEAGLEIIQHALLLLGHDQEATREMVGDLRRDGYQRFSRGRAGWHDDR